MEKLFAMAVPILPGQTERWKKFMNTLKTEKFDDFKKSRNELGVRERTFLQQTPMGDYVIVTLEGNDPENAMAKVGKGNDAFTKWFNSEVKTINGLDLANPPQSPMPELIIDSEATTGARG